MLQLEERGKTPSTYLHFFITPFSSTNPFCGSRAPDPSPSPLSQPLETRKSSKKISSWNDPSIHFFVISISELFDPQNLPIPMADSTAAASSSPFSILSDDVVLKIFVKLDCDPRDWARLACVSARFSILIRNTCCKAKCFRSIPSVLSDLLSTSDGEDNPPGGWAAFHKLSICCPGLLHAGVLLENSDFGLEREIGPDEDYRSSSSSSALSITTVAPTAAPAPLPVPATPDCGWSLFDDLYFDTVYDASEELQSLAAMETEEPETIIANASDREFSKSRKDQCDGNQNTGAHLATGAWNLSREQGNKLLASRFRGDCLYICDWPGCVHAEEKRNYMLFRGVFKNFKRSRVWRTINDGNRRKTGLDCAFCPCKETWDLHSAFCLRRVFGYHDDGEPVVRAFVCENGHVSGAWTERPLYT